MRINTQVQSPAEAERNAFQDATEFAADGQLRMVTDDVPEPEVEAVRLDLLPPDSILAGDPPDSTFIGTVHRFGMLNAILLISTPNGTYPYEVAEGRRRIKAARHLNNNEIRARVFPPGWTSAQVLTLVANDSRRKNALADYDAIKFLQREKRASDREIAAVTGMNIETIRKRLQLSRLIPELLAACREMADNERPRMRISVAEAAAKIPPADQQAVLLPILARSGHLTMGDVAAAKRVKNLQLVATLGNLVADTPSLADIQSAQRTANQPRGEGIGWRLAVSLILRDDALPLIPRDASGEQSRAALEFLVRQLEASDGSTHNEEVQPAARVAVSV